MILQPHGSIIFNILGICLFVSNCTAFSLRDNELPNRINDNYTRKKELILPPRLKDAKSKNMLVSLELQNSMKEPIDLYILGTVHIGSESAKDAVTLLETIRPSNVVLELPPSRYETLQKKYILQKQSKGKKKNASSSMTTSQTEMNILDALCTIPKLAVSGWSNSGISGFLFSTFIVGSSLVKRSLTSKEEQAKLPRQNEFTAAVEAANEINATVIPADFEFEELLYKVTQSISVLGWIQLLFQTSFGEILRLVPVDPIRRMKGESINEWEMRRRNIETSRSSKRHGELVSPALSKVLVDDRDVRFAKKCNQILNTIPCKDDNLMTSNNMNSKNAIVCIVGLVHLDGVVSQVQLHEKKQ